MHNAPCKEHLRHVIYSKGETSPVLPDCSAVRQRILSYLRALRALSPSCAHRTIGKGAATLNWGRHRFTWPWVTLLGWFASKWVTLSHQESDSIAPTWPKNTPALACAFTARPTPLLSNLAPTNSTTQSFTVIRTVSDQETRTRVDEEFGNMSSVSKHSFPWNKTKPKTTTKQFIHTLWKMLIKVYFKILADMSVGCNRNILWIDRSAIIPCLSQV